MANCFIEKFTESLIEPDGEISFATSGDGVADPDETTFDIYLTHESGLSYDAMINNVWQTGFNGTITGPTGFSRYVYTITTHPDLLIGTWTMLLVGTCPGHPWASSLTQIFDVDCDEPSVTGVYPSGTTTTFDRIQCTITDPFLLDLSRLRLDVISALGVTYRAIDAGIIQAGWTGSIISNGDSFPESITIKLTAWPSAIASGELFTFALSAQNKVLKNLGDYYFSDYCVDLDGINKYIRVGDELDFAHTDPFTISAWVKTELATAVVVAKFNAPNPGYRLFVDVGTIRLWLEDGVGDINVSGAAATISDGYWHHIVARYDGSASASGVSFLYDGEVVTPTITTDTLTGTMANSDNLMFGNQTSGALKFAGHIDEISFWSESLTDPECVELWNSGTAPDLAEHSRYSDCLGWWQCGDGDTYPTIYDKTGNGYDATLFFCVADDIILDSPRDWSDLGESSFVARYCADLDGVNNSVTMGDVLDKVGTDPFSICLWFKTTTAVSSYLISKQTTLGNQEGYSIRLFGDVINVVLRSAAGYIFRQTGVITNKNDGNWHFLCMTYDGSQVAANCLVYLDSIPEPMSTIIDTLAGTMANTSPLLLSSIWRATPPVSPLTGRITNVSMWSKELSQAEITEIYNGGIPGDLFLFSDWGSNEGWWQIGEGDTYDQILDHSANENHGTMTNMSASDLVEDSPS